MNISNFCGREGNEYLGEVNSHQKNTPHWERKGRIRTETQRLKVHKRTTTFKLAPNDHLLRYQGRTQRNVGATAVFPSDVSSEQESLCITL